MTTQVDSRRVATTNIWRDIVIETIMAIKTGNTLSQSDLGRRHGINNSSISKYFESIGLKTATTKGGPYINPALADPKHRIDRIHTTQARYEIAVMAADALRLPPPEKPEPVTNPLAPLLNEQPAVYQNPPLQRRPIEVEEPVSRRPSTSDRKDFLGVLDDMASGPLDTRRQKIVRPAVVKAAALLSFAAATIPDGGQDEIEELRSLAKSIGDLARRYRN